MPANPTESTDLSTIPPATAQTVEDIRDRLALVWERFADADDITATESLVEIWPLVQSMSTAITGLLEVARQFRVQRDTALDEAGFWRANGTSNAHRQIVHALQLELDISHEDAGHILDYLTGSGVAEPSPYYHDRLVALLEEIADQIKEELAPYQPDQEEYFE